jgi:aryl-alcohol dehydrogenase-like predicted oxidoreductase
MDYRNLGKSGIKVSPVGMGCWAYGSGDYWGKQSQVDVDNVVSLALDLGCNFFDTAELYNNGASETSLGLALRGKRDKAVVATKIGPAFTKKDIIQKHLDMSLKRLKMDYVDCYMLHWPLNRISIKHFTDDPAILADPPTENEVFTALDKLKKAGKIRSIGVSNFGIKQLEAVVKTGVQIDMNEITYNLLSRAVEGEILPYCIENDISLIASMSLQQGLLAGIYESVDKVPGPQAHSRHFHFSRGGNFSRHTQAGVESELFVAICEIQRIANDLDIHISQLSIAWLLATKGVDVALAGSRNIDELKSNVAAGNLVLDKQTIKALDSAGRPLLELMGFNADYYEDPENSRIY